jgi:8-oxo-dGTP pyrophosphatase MutT (NUDIX family)/transcriptional regulator with XRE-family HTH domain
MMPRVLGMPPPDDTAAARVPLGPVGRYVIENLKQLRDARRLTYRELADRLATLGRPIPTLGLSRIEKGTRRVDADDLVALAIALGVNPAALLLPRDVAPGDEIKLAQELPVAAVAAWEWSAGNYPLPTPDTITWQQIADFEANARPEWLGRPVSEWRDEVARRDAEMKELQRKAEAAEEQLRVERARNGHPEELVPPVVAAIVTSDLGVLVGRRNDGKPPWTFIAGEQDAVQDESPEDTAIREVKEETGLQVVTGDVIGQRVHPKTQRTMIYIAARPTHGTEIFVGDEDELAEVRWISLAEADELLPGMFEPVHEHLARELGEG